MPHLLDSDIDEERIALIKLLRAFNHAMFCDMLRARREGKSGWQCVDEDNIEFLREQLTQHVADKKYVGAAALAAFLWMHEEHRDEVFRLEW